MGTTAIIPRTKAIMLKDTSFFQFSSCFHRPLFLRAVYNSPFRTPFSLSVLFKNMALSGVYEQHKF